MKDQFDHSHMSPKWFFSCFNILLWDTLYFPEIRVSCICENVSLVGHYMKIVFKCSEPLPKTGWASHRQISCENNPVLEPQRSRCPTEQLPSTAVTSRSLLLSCDHVLCISYPDAHDWGQMFSTLNVALWDSVHFSVGCAVADTGTREQLKRTFPCNVLVSRCSGYISFPFNA